MITDAHRAGNPPSWTPRLVITELIHLALVAAVGGLSGAIAHELNQPLGAILRQCRSGAASADPRSSVNRRRGAGRDLPRHRGQQRSRSGRRSAREAAAARPAFHPPRARAPLNLSAPSWPTFCGSSAASWSDARCRCSADLPASLGMVQGDAVQTQQVVLNLVMNACEAMEQNPVARPRDSSVTLRHGSAAAKWAARSCGTSGYLKKKGGGCRSRRPTSGLSAVRDVRRLRGSGSACSSAVASWSPITASSGTESADPGAIVSRHAAAARLSRVGPWTN